MTWLPFVNGVETYVQHELKKDMPDGEHRRIAFMSYPMLSEWMDDGWSVRDRWTGVVMVKNKEGRLVPIWSL